MLTNEFVIELENKPGQLASLCDAIGSEDIGLKAIATDRLGGQSFIRIIVDKNEKMKAMLDEGDYMYTENTVVVKTIGDTPNALTGAARKLGAGGVNIDAIYLLNRGTDRVNLVFALDNPEKGANLLKD